MEELMSLVRTALGSEPSSGGQSSSSSFPVAAAVQAPPRPQAPSPSYAEGPSSAEGGGRGPFLGIQERKILINLAKALEVTAYAQSEEEIKSKLGWLRNLMHIANGMLEEWMKVGSITTRE